MTSSEEAQVKGLIKKVLLGLVGIIVLFGSYSIVSPGNRGIMVTNGSVSATVRSEGMHMKWPMISDIHQVSVRQQTNAMKAECYSTDLQQITAEIKILYRIPEGEVVPIFQKYAGDPFDSLIAPRAQEAFKETTATRSAEQIVREREKVKQEALAALQKKVGGLLVVEDFVIENLELSKDLENAIESKMVQEQEKEKAKFTKEKAEIDAQTAFIRAQGEAKAINIRGEALRNNPSVVDLTIAEHWNGVTPQSVIVGHGGANVLLPLHGDK